MKDDNWQNKIPKTNQINSQLSPVYNAHLDKKILQTLNLVLIDFRTS